MGLLHDCAKEMSGTSLAAHVKRHRLTVPGWEFIRRQKSWGLLHATVSADLARRTYGLKDSVALKAIARHTLGADRMGLLDTLLYVADFSAPGRKFSAAAPIRRLARKNLQEAFRETVRLKILYVLSLGDAVHPQTVALWNGLCP
jgi:predicted HD superfamily hydrolase involved in NAD metabolism